MIPVRPDSFTSVTFCDTFNDVLDIFVTKIKCWVVVAFTSVTFLYTFAVLSLSEMKIKHLLSMTNIAENFIFLI